MINRLCILVCENHEPEVKAVVEAEGFDNVIVATFPAKCDPSPIGWDILGEAIHASAADCHQIYLIGDCCLVGLKGPPEELAYCQIHKMDSPFGLTMGANMVNAYIRSGAYLVTPGWLARWRRYIEAWGFDQGAAREFFGECATRLVLLDSRVDARSAEHLRRFSEFVGLPYEIVPVGLDFTRLVVIEIVLEWRLECQRGESAVAVAKANQQSADYAMVFDLIGNLTGIVPEVQAVERIFELFTVLCAPNRLVYIPFINGQPGNVQTRPASLVPTMEMKRHLDDFQEDDALRDLEDGFLLRIRRDGRTLGILIVEGFAFPEQKQRYLNLALNIASTLSLAISNARLYEAERQRAAELQDALAHVRALRGLLPICMHCKKIRNDEGYWQQLEVYIEDRSEAEFTHGLCPDCSKEFYPGFHNG